MASACASCQANIGLFSEYYIFYAPSKRKYCSKCSSQLIPFHDALSWHSNACNKIALNAAYQALQEAIAKHDLPEAGRAMIEEDCQNYYEDILKTCPDMPQDEQQKIELRKRVNALMTTTSFNFEGYDITEYFGVISEFVAQGTGFLSELSAEFNDMIGTQSNTFSEKMKTARDSALEKLQIEAVQLGANALLGISFEMTVLRNNMLGVMVTGTAVNVKKKE